MNVLVTGGAGFIGSHLSERLLTLGHSVCIVDDLNDFYAPEEKRANLHAIEAVGPVRFEQLDIRNEAAMERLFSSHKPDMVIHLAARAGVRPSVEQPLLYEAVNAQGTLVLLDACRRHHVPKMVLASSSSVYGETSKVPFSEEEPVNRPISPYAASKLSAEHLAYTYTHLHGISVIALRFFTVYGPRQRPDLAIRKFIERISAGKPITLYGDGSTSRDYTFVKDTVQGIEGAMNLDAPWEVINLGNSSPVSLLEMVRTIEQVLGRQAQVQWLPDQPGDVPVTYADISKAQRLLNYQPQTKLADGIRLMAAWLEERRARLAVA